jgi:hypothetical protein
MLERSEGLAYQAEHHVQEIQRICPHVSGRFIHCSHPSIDIYTIWTSIIVAEVRKLQLCPVLIMSGSCFFFKFIRYRALSV